MFSTIRRIVVDGVRKMPISFNRSYQKDVYSSWGHRIKNFYTKVGTFNAPSRHITELAADIDMLSEKSFIKKSNYWSLYHKGGVSNPKLISLCGDEHFKKTGEIYNNVVVAVSNESSMSLSIDCEPPGKASVFIFYTSQNPICRNLCISNGNDQKNHYIEMDNGSHIILDSRRNPGFAFFLEGAKERSYVKAYMVIVSREWTDSDL